MAISNQPTEENVDKAVNGGAMPLNAQSEKYFSTGQSQSQRQRVCVTTGVGIAYRR